MGISAMDAKMKNISSLEDVQLLKVLRDACVRRQAEICIERARNITQYYLSHPPSGESSVIRYARAVNHFLSHKEPLFFDDNLLAGSTTSKPFGAPVYPELTGLTIWPELDTISTRDKNPLALSAADREELNLKIFPYWMERSILEYARKKNGNPLCMKLFERIVFFMAGKPGCLSHTVPGYRVVLEKGLDGILEEALGKEEQIRGRGSLSVEEREKADFFRAVGIAMEGIKKYAGNLSAKAAFLAGKETDPIRKANFEAMAQVCSRVPAQPARTFREAVNSLWIAQVAVHAENINMAISPGRLDQILYPYYRDDVRDGRLTVNEAIELVGCLWLKLNDNTNLVPATAEELFGGAGTVPAVTVGGVDQEGEDAVNDLTYLMLKVTELLKTRDPNLNARYNYEKNTVSYGDRIAGAIACTRSVPAFHNDKAVIGTLVNQGMKIEHARDYAVIGCVEPGLPGRSYDASSSLMLNLVSVLELALYNGKRPITGPEVISFEGNDPASCRTFMEFWEIFKKHLIWVIDRAVELNNLLGKAYQETLPSPLLSAFFDGPLESGRDLIFGGALYNSSGATHIGFADTVDSLNAVEQAVYLERKCTFDGLIQALKDNFRGHESLHAYLVMKTPKYGTDHPIAVKNSRNLLRFLYETYQKRTNYRGGKYKPGYWSMTNHAGQGKLTGALPNGRKSGKTLASGITPCSQAAPDLATCLRMVGGLDSLWIPGGEAFNIKFPSLEDTADQHKFGAAVEAYFRYGGMHVQCNVLSYAMLLDAKKNPDKYPDLLVRVSGYSAYFSDLNDTMKDEIIARTEYGIGRGAADIFPADSAGMLPYA